MDIMTETGADFVMIARGAQGDPDIFARCKALWEGKPVPEPNSQSLMDALITQAEIACAHKGEGRAIAELRKHALWYLGNLIGAKPLKTEAACINSLSELRQICKKAIDQNLKARGKHRLERRNYSRQSSKGRQNRL